MKMKVWPFLVAFALAGCETSRMAYNNAEQPLRNPYEVIAPMRVMLKVTDDPRKATFDHLLTEARKVHGADVDIKNLAKDAVNMSGSEWHIYNFYVVRYNRFD